MSYARMIRQHPSYRRYLDQIAPSAAFDLARKHTSSAVHTEVLRQLAAGKHLTRSLLDYVHQQTQMPQNGYPSIDQFDTDHWHIIQQAVDGYWEVRRLPPSRCWGLRPLPSFASQNEAREAAIAIDALDALTVPWMLHQTAHGWIGYHWANRKISTHYRSTPMAVFERAYQLTQQAQRAGKFELPQAIMNTDDIDIIVARLEQALLHPTPSTFAVLGTIFEIAPTSGAVAFRLIQQVLGQKNGRRKLDAIYRHIAQHARS